MRLASAQIGGGREAAVVLWGGNALQVADLPGGWPADLLSLLEGGRLEDLRLRWGGFTEEELEGLAGRAVPAGALSYAPLYRRPRKIWGIGLNYAEHAGDLDERTPAEEPASFMRPDTTIVGPGDTVRLPGGAGRVTAEAGLAIVIGKRAKDIGEDEAA